MSDMRQKLLPVFLEEAGRKILQLDGFIAAGSGEGRSLADLEAAFRAAHTLKGTAALVQAEAVRSLSGRIEGLLEGHFEQGRFPSETEYEAMQLALDRLKQLIDAVAKKQDEPIGVLTEAELALKLAMTMPGRRRLAELMTPVHSVDPFADDPDFEDQDSAACNAAAAPMMDDPFADDPEIEQTSAVRFHQASTPHPVEVDPFADDPALDLAFAEEASIPPVQGAKIHDPFADDPALEYLPEEPFSETAIAESTSAPLHGSYVSDDEGLVAAVRDESAPAPAQQDSFIERMRRRIEKESPLQTAERLAKTLLSQNEGDSVARQYSCCHFRVAAKDYYLPIANMIEISDLPKIVHLPLAPAVVRGLINLRGQVLPVIDLGLQAGGTSRYVAVRKLVIAEAGGEKLAFLTDGIPNLSEDLLGEKVDVMNFVDQFRAGAS